MAYPNLIAEMNRIGITTKDIAQVVGKSTDTVNNWLKGRSEFPIGKAFLVQKRFFPKMSISYLFNPKPQPPDKWEEIAQ